MTTNSDASPQENTADLTKTWLDRSYQVRASDLHFEPDSEGLAIKMRIDGLLHMVKRVDSDLGRQLVSRMMVMAQLRPDKQKMPQEGRAEYTSEKTGEKPVSLRVSTFPTIHGNRAVLRFFHGLEEIPTLDKLGYTDQIRTLLDGFVTRGQGMILVAGPAGSGKTTTVYSLLNHIMTEKPGFSIISIEDPAESSIDGITQVQIGEDSGGLTYKQALKSFLRQDPQVVAIGEIRDGDTAAVCLEAALTGHLLISTIHSPSAAGVIMRLLDMGMPAYQLPGAITGVLCQRLVRVLCPSCKIATDDPDEPYMSAGCNKCFKTGFRGRIPIAEAAYMTPRVHEVVMKGSDTLTLYEAMKEDGLTTLASDAERLVKGGLTTREQVADLLHPVQ